MEGENMRVLMLKDLAKVGKKGQIVDVSDGYGANFLIPQGYGRRFDEAALKDYKANLKQEDLKRAELKALAEQEKSKMQGLVLQFEANWGRNGYMIGQISAKQIETALKAKGFNVDKKKFINFTPITSFGSTKIEIELYKGVIATIEANVKDKNK